MNNAEKFKQIFGLYATELWAMPEEKFLEWLNAQALEKDGNWCQFRWSAEHDRAVVGAWKPLPEPYTEEEA